MMTTGEQSNEPAMPSASPLHDSLKAHSILEDEPTESTKSVSSSGSSVRKEKSNNNKNNHNSGTTVHRIREFRQRRRSSLGGGEVEEEEKSSDPSGLSVSNHSLNVSNHSGSAVQRIRQYRQKRKETMGEQGLDASSTHSATWQKHASIRRMDKLSEFNEMEENPLLSPASSRKKFGNGESGGASSRRLNRVGSGTSLRTLTQGGSGASSRRLLNRDGSNVSTRRLTRDASGRLVRDGGGASTRRLTKDGSGISPRRLTRDSAVVSTRGLSLTQNPPSPESNSKPLSSLQASSGTPPTEGNNGYTTSLSQSTHSPGDLNRSGHSRSSLSRSRQSHGDLNRSGHSRGSLSRTQKRRRQLKEHLRANNDHSNGPMSPVSTDGASSYDSLPSNSNVKGTTLELLALIKKRRQARNKARGRDENHRTSLSPMPAKRERPVRQRSLSFSPGSRHRKRVPIPALPDVNDNDGPKKWSYSAHSISRQSLSRDSHSSSSSFHNSFAGNSVDSFHADEEEEEDVPRPPCNPAKHEDHCDDDSHDSPKGVMEFPEGAKKTNSPEMDTVHQEKMKRMRAELEELQAQVSKMEEAKAQDMQELKDHFQARKAEMMESAKKKIQTHLESEMELKLFAMDVEKTRLNKMQEVLEKDKQELKASIKDVQANINELIQENKRLDAENKEIHRMYIHLSKWVEKTTKQNEKLQLAEEKLQKIYSGSIALIVEEKLSIVYRKFMYKVAQGVNCCNDFDFGLNEEVWDMIKEVEQENEKEVIDLHEIDEWERELERKERASKGVLGMRISYGLDDQDDGISASIRTRSTLGSLDFGSVDMSIDMSKRGNDLPSRARSSFMLEDMDAGFETDEAEEYYSETEVDVEFEEDIQRLNDSVMFYENVLAEVSMHLDANQMNTLHDNKDMLISIFKFMDVDGSGDIDLEEFKVGIELLNKRLPEDSHFRDAEELFKMLDVDNSGSIDMEQFERVFGDDEED